MISNEAILPYYMYCHVEIVFADERGSYAGWERQIQILNTTLLNAVGIGSIKVLPLLRPEDDMTDDETAIWFGMKLKGGTGPEREAKAVRYLTQQRIDVFELIKHGLAKQVTRDYYEQLGKDRRVSEESTVC